MKNINQTAEELDILSVIVKSQQKMLGRFKEQESESGSETLKITLQKLEVFHSDLEEYKRSCARLAKIVRSPAS